MTSGKKVREKFSRIWEETAVSEKERKRERAARVKRKRKIERNKDKNNYCRRRRTFKKTNKEREAA